MTVQENIHRAHKTQKQIYTHKQHQLHRHIYTCIQTYIYYIYLQILIDFYLSIEHRIYMVSYKCFLEENVCLFNHFDKMHHTLWNTLKVGVVHGDVQFNPGKQMGVTATEVPAVDAHSQVITCPPLCQNRRSWKQIEKLQSSSVCRIKS